ncbi:23S rRNA (adenine(2030)-N(6))-methyltransferase RlmJ [Methylotenera versatilis]|uniref:23S rRNA (adenine(2030)-N(6))-methyltransferase RlmJ n=1 Tax=Methylotenera versatilis TaxID=1055487 RepID=UPI000647A623|nr:23S rRNA (adenine(2030)-N(6))-methyltransferase RlmJ [Methylotenera versatilis]
MLSYRHAFHAGNHADVLKHYVLSLVLDYFNQKPTPYWYIDTHAGAGFYALKDAFSQKNGEFETGIARLIDAQRLSPTLSHFVDNIQSFNEKKLLDFYPGSPKIAERFLRADDKMRLFELHPKDYQLLLENFINAKSRQTKVAQQNGFDGIKACLPPPPRRAVVLIDPPYEVKDDYVLVVDCIKDSLKRFATGTYMIWYPLLQRPEPQQMLQNLQKLNPKNWLNISLTVQSPSENGYGMHGSSVFIINPPYVLPALLNESMPILTELLSLDEAANYQLTSHMT